MALTLPNNPLADHLLRLKRLWFLILISGLLHLLVGEVYLTTEMSHYYWLSKVFIWATISKAVFELVLSWFFWGRLTFLALPAPLFDIVLGVFLMVAPVIPLFFLPFYIAFGLGLRGAIQLRQLRAATSAGLKALSSVRSMGLIQIGFGLLIVANALLDPVNIGPAGLAILGAGVVYIVLAIQLKLLKPQLESKK